MCIRDRVQTVRLFVDEMEKNDLHYPLHLGVTEAGDGEDGRIKSVSYTHLVYKRQMHAPLKPSTEEVSTRAVVFRIRPLN